MKRYDCGSLRVEQGEEKPNAVLGLCAAIDFDNTYYQFRERPRTSLPAPTKSSALAALVLLLAETLVRTAQFGSAK
ncbi:MAG TPA: hypothetical protein VE871_07530 [Longimicrobium sp.]|nr:hypothetical protein [Longimicrobium sp.]